MLRPGGKRPGSERLDRVEPHRKRVGLVRSRVPPSWQRGHDTNESIPRIKQSQLQRTLPFLPESSRTVAAISLFPRVLHRSVIAHIDRRGGDTLGGHQFKATCHHLGHPHGHGTGIKRTPLKYALIRLIIAEGDRIRWINVFAQLFTHRRETDGGRRQGKKPQVPKRLSGWRFC